MTSDLTVEFLLLHYSNIDFLINRAEIQSSLFIDNYKKIKSKNRYLTGIIHFNNENILSVDFDSYLKETFRLNENNDNSIAIVYDTAASGLYKNIGRYFIKKKGYPELSPNHIGLIINNNFELVKVPLYGIKLMPESLRKNNSENGILGIRFSEGKNQYYIDIERIIKKLF